jgi:uncharacterized RDD family membrane protein YckC
MLEVKLDTGFNIEIDFRLAPFFKRAFARFIDFWIIVGYYLLGSWALRSVMGETWTSKGWIIVLFGLPPFLYHLLCEIFLNGQSLGKKIMRVKVIAADGGQPSVSQYLIRWLFLTVDFPLIWVIAAISYGILPWWCFIFIFSGLVCFIATPYSQRIGDLVAGTILIDTRNRTSWEDTVFTEVEEDYQPRYPKVMQLTDKDINTLKGIINTVSKSRDYDLSIRIAERIRSKLDIRSDQDSLDFLQTLLKDYNYYSTR